MTLILNGTDNSATTPAVTGTDTDTGVFFPAANVVAFATSGTEDGRFDASGNLLVGSTNAAGRFYSVTPNNQWAAYAENGLSSGLNSGILALVSAQNSANNSYKAIVYYNAGAGQDRFSVADSGAIATAGSIALGTNGNPPTSGIGVQFPATQSASADANTLDDYEEGTFTPVLNRSDSSPTVTYVVQNGKYTKVGNMVTVTIALQASAVSPTGSGNTTITGLPFSNGSTTYTGQGSIGYNTAGVNTLSGSWMSSTTVFFRSGTRSDGNDATGWGVGYLNMSITYLV
jgi:hypothetical protein